MKLQDGVVAVRDAIGEGTAWYFSNGKIIMDLNRSARAMCSAAQSIRDSFITTTALIPERILEPYDITGDTYYMEYALPQNCESVTGAKIKVGIEYNLNFTFGEPELVQGGFIAATPFAAYITKRTKLKQMLPNGGQIIMLDIPGNAVGQAYWIIGLAPIPAAANPLCVDYVAYHPEMDSPLSPVLLPEDTIFFDAWTAYAISKAKEKEGDLVSADRYMKIHRDGIVAFKEYQATRQLQVNPPRYGGRGGTLSPNVFIASPVASQLSIQGE